jgi:hypothetical protein
VPETHLEKLSIHPKVRVQCKFQLGKNVDANNSSHRPIHLLIAGHVSCLHQCLHSILSQFTHLVPWQWFNATQMVSFPATFVLASLLIGFWIFSRMRWHQVAICFHSKMNKNLWYPQL